MTRHRTVFVTARAQRHQQAALNAAPAALDIVMLRQPDRETLLARLPGAEYLISERAGVIDAALIRAAPKLKLILRLGSLSHDIDLDAARAAGVQVCYWPVASVVRVAEHVVLQMLALGRKLREAETIVLEAGGEWGRARRTDEDTFHYNWSRRENIEGLWQKTVGIIGFGEIGAELARRLRGWGCTLRYHKRRRLPPHVEQALGITFADVDTLLATGDYVVNLLPYAPDTDLLIGAAYFAKMQTGAFLVSAGSGGVIDEAALAAALESGKLGGAALDTFEWEPIKAGNPLIALAKARYNVLLTPHIAAGAVRGEDEERRAAYTNIVNHIEGNPLKYRLV